MKKEKNIYGSRLVPYIKFIKGISADSQFFGITSTDCERRSSRKPEDVLRRKEK